MRILHVWRDYFPPSRGGIEQTISRLAVGAVRAGADVTVVTSNPGRRRDLVETVDGVRVVRCAELGRIASTAICPTMIPWMAATPADIIHLHYPFPPGDVAALLTGKGRRIVVTYHSDIVRQKLLKHLHLPIAHAILDRADLLMPTSPQYIESSKLLRPRRDHCRVIPHGIDLEPFEHLDRFAATASELRERYGTPLVLFVGRFRYYKGLDVLLRAMVSVPAHLVLLGGGAEERNIRALASSLAIADRVHFVLDADEAGLLAHLAAADICVLPSTHRAEALGLALIEGLAAGLPLVSTELGTGTSFVNVHEETGLVVRPRDAAALAGALTRLASDPAERRRFGEAGRRRARDLFSADVMIRSVVEVYESVVGRPIAS